MAESTFFTYSEGIDPSLLNIGNMALDYANPRRRQPYRHATLQDLLGIPPLATADERTICTLGLDLNTTNAFGGGVAPLLQLERSGATRNATFIVGTNGSKIELIDPETFFQERVLTQPKARLWLETRLSIGNYLKAAYKNIVSLPKIWLLTGIYLVEDAKVFTIMAKSTGGSVSIDVPVPDPSGLAMLLGVSLGASANVGKSYQATALTQILGKKVWAAQWTRVDAKYYRTDIQATNTQLKINQLKLLDVFSSNTTRGNKRESDCVELEIIHSPDMHVPPDNEEDYSEEVWAEFDERLQGLMDDLGEDI